MILVCFYYVLLFIVPLEAKINSRPWKRKQRNSPTNKRTSSPN